ncbi:hypothetical protein K466DRAFT_490214, partial [Polyporus arcularius HHB13444]
VRGLLYAMNVLAPRLIQLPLRTEPDDVFEASGWVEDVDVAHWFPHGARYTRVVKMPGACRKLSNQFTVVTAKDQRRCALNFCVLRRFGRFVRGNVLVIRHRSRLPELATNMSSCEKQFVDVIVDE